MAPALTEPISPKEKLTSSGTATATPATAARASRKIDTENYITNNNNNNNNNTTITPLKQSPTLREKRNCNNNNSNSIPVVQVPTTSTIRLTRSRDLQQRLLSSSPKCKDKQQHQQPIITQSKPPILTTSGDTVNNEQMGLSTAVLETKNQIINQNTNTATTELIAAAEEEHQNPDAVQKAAAVAATKEADTTSTAQLLADLTNEAITADICLRKQLKDVNLVKAVAEGSSSPLQRDRDIVVIKSISTSSPPSNSLDTAHMDTQCSGEEDASTTTNTNDEEGNKYQTVQQGNEEEEEEGSQIKETNHVTPEDVKNSNDVVVTEETNKNTNECHLSSDVLDSYPPDSPLESDEESKKDGNSKPEIISVQELPPVNTDSTMTASEVEDNLEERLSQLDGTAIDSPPPNNDDVEDDKDDVFKSAQLVMESTHTAAATTTPPRTPTHQQTLAKDMQDIQQQLQHTPPTPVAQQVQAHHHHQMQQQQQLQQVLPQQNCLTPQSTASSINTVGSGNIPQSFIKEAEAGTELEDQDIEEVFKVLKGFEGGGSSDLNVCDLNVLFNEAYMKMNESDIGGTTGGNSQVAVAGVSSSSSSSISNSHVSHSHVSVATENPSIQPVKPTELEEAQKDIEERQRQMQRKVDILMRRLRKLQARYMCKHTSEEIAGLFELTARQSSKGVNANHVVENPIGSDPNSQDITKYFQKVIASRPPASDWKSEQEELVPAKQISTLLRKIETVANAQQHCLTPVNASNNNNNNNINPNNFHIAPTKKSKKALLEAQQNAAAAAAGTTGSSLKNDTTTLDSSAEGRNAEDIIVATLEENVTTELTQVTGLLQTEMYEVQRAIDSDATESSSGGESADEMVVFNNQQQQTLPITKRAAWRYSRDRAAIASRWSWLLSQIADLEIKIRQHSELYQEILKAKGPVISCPRDNGLKVDRNDKDLDDDALEGSSCRTRGFNPAQFRKRKLIQTTNMHTISKKAARPSTIKCGCQWPIHPCALCTGRADPTAPRDLPDTMMMSERIALLDAGYHPVLSFRENVNNALHFEAIAKQPEWQQRVMRCQAKHIAKSVWKAEREAVAGKKFNDGGAPPIKRRYVKKKDRDDKGTQQQQQQQQARGTMPTSTDGAAAGATQMASASSCSVNNDQPTTLATTSTTPLVANKSVTKSGKKQTCQILSDVILKNPSNQQPSPLRLSTTSSAAATVTTATAMNSIHQTSDCHHPTSYDPYNLNPTHSSSISNNNSNSSSSKSNKHRKLSSASTAATSHHYNQHNNHLYNGESGFTHHNYDWSGAAGGVDAITARSRTSSPTHGGGSTSSNYHSKNERSFDRKNRVSYDIDNIVIPYSVAAATRVEILPYKEIPTPKWRIVNTTTTTSDETANVETSDNNGNRNVTTNGDVLSDDGDNRNSNNNNNNTTPNTFTKNEIKPTNGDEIKMLAPPSSSLCDSSRSDHKISDKATSHRQTSMCPTTSKDVVVVGVDKGSKCLENGETILNNGSCEPAMVEEPVEKKPKMEPNVIKNEHIQPPSTSSCTSSASASLVHNVDTNDRRIVVDAIGPDDEYCEDISDEAMILRHERALTEERRKFQTFLKFPWSTRSRANRRIDSRAESSGANTPDPSSPAPHTPIVGGGDQDSIPSPSTPSTPLNILDTISEAGDNSTSFLGVGFMSSHSSKRQERRRTTSAKRDFERRSSTPDSKELIPPYEPMRFPLTDEQFEELQSAMPSEHNEDSKRFDDCYFPGGGGGGGLGVGMRTRYCSGPTTAAGNSSSKRSSRSSTMCGGERRPKGSLKNTSSIEDVNAMMTLENNCTDNNNMDDEDYDDYPKHHLATNDDHLTADDCDDPGGIHNDDMMMYGDGEDGDYVFANSRRKHGGDSDGDSTETEPFQDDDPNDPEWRGETEDRSRKKAV